MFEMKAGAALPCSCQKVPAMLCIARNWCLAVFVCLTLLHRAKETYACHSYDGMTCKSFLAPLYLMFNLSILNKLEKEPANTVLLIS